MRFNRLTNRGSDDGGDAADASGSGDMDWAFIEAHFTGYGLETVSEFYSFFVRPAARNRPVSSIFSYLFCYQLVIRFAETASKKPSRANFLNPLRVNPQSADG